MSLIASINGRLARVFSAGWNMASNRKYSSLISVASLSVGSIRPHSIPFGSARPGPTGLGFQPEMASVRLSSVSRSVKKKTRASCPLSLLGRCGVPLPSGLLWTLRRNHFCAMVANTIVLYTFDKFPIYSIARFKSTSFIIYRNISSFNFVK